jgi:hypothetical protein
MLKLLAYLKAPTRDSRPGMFPTAQLLDEKLALEERTREVEFVTPVTCLMFILPFAPESTK